MGVDNEYLLCSWTYSYENKMAGLRKKGFVTLAVDVFQGEK